MIRTIPRERVRSRVREALRLPVTVLRAPAGFGKSIVLEQSLEGDTVSYALTQDVDGPWAFLRGLANALDSATPSVPLSLSAAWDRAAEAKAPAALPALYRL